MSEGRKELERIAATMELMRAELGMLEERLTLIGSALAEITLAKRSLEELKKDQAAEVLLHIGASVRLPGTIKVIRPTVNVGRNIHVEMSADKALEFLKGREEELRRSEEELRRRREEIVRQYEGLNARAGELYAQMQGRGSGNVQIP
ncbi:prefoldin subunit alpha [Thermoplasmatales archaeon ex4484_36]|nr:MAG: prefoldin subunit alpha [Thermoplasmatales archaeon ex4484_36]RLF71753.1 MAG: prefoldin subunit alpha [Thermoplasmata archaeon]RLF74764.1 MAG: prefoldin subunit alpha [Thermoplasmata archaeon]